MLSYEWFIFYLLDDIKTTFHYASYPYNEIRNLAIAFATIIIVIFNKFLFVKQVFQIYIIVLSILTAQN